MSSIDAVEKTSHVNLADNLCYRGQNKITIIYIFRNRVLVRIGYI